MKKYLSKIIGITFVLALALNIVSPQRIETELPPLHGTNTITQTHIS